MKIKSLAFFSLLCTSAATAETAIVCEQCSTPSAAMEFAKSHADNLQCRLANSLETTCQSSAKVVTLVDADSGQAYQYKVFHQNSSPWRVQAERLALSSERETSFRLLMEFIHGVAAAIQQSSTDISQLTGSPGTQPGAVSAASPRASCPPNTALSTLLNPNRLDAIKSSASIAIGSNLATTMPSLELNPVKIGQRYSLTMDGVTSSILVPEFRGTNRNWNPVFTVAFDESEQPGSRNDFFAYQVDLLGFDAEHLPIMNFELLGASQVAGYRLEHLTGTNGPMVIENSCVKEQFATAVNNRVLTPAVHYVNPVDDANPAAQNSEWPFPTAAAGCTVIDLVQDETRSYSFRTCI